MPGDPDAAVARGSGGSGTAPCAGCLGTRECWICGGTGALDTRIRIGTCTSCQGTRVCRYCLDDALPRRRANDVILPLSPSGDG